MIELFQEKDINIFIDSDEQTINRFKNIYHLNNCSFNDYKKPIDILVINNFCLVNRTKIKTTSIRELEVYEDNHMNLVLSRKTNLSYDAWRSSCIPINSSYLKDYRFLRWNQNTLREFVFNHKDFLRDTEDGFSSTTCYDDQITLNKLYIDHINKETKGRRLCSKDFEPIPVEELTQLTQNVLYDNEELNNLFSMLTSRDEKSFILALNCLTKNYRYMTNIIISTLIFKCLAIRYHGYKKNNNNILNNLHVNVINYRVHVLRYLSSIISRYGDGYNQSHIFATINYLKNITGNSLKEDKGIAFEIYNSILSTIINNDPFQNAKYSIHKYDYDFFTNPYLISKVYSPFSNILDLSSIKFKPIKQKKVSDGSTADYEEFNL